MKRLICVGVLATLVCGVLAAPAFASELQDRVKVARTPAPRVPAPAVTQSGVRLGFAPLGIVLSGTSTLNGTVRDFDGVGQAEAFVEAAVPFGTGWDYNYTTTAPDGTYSLGGFAAAAGNGELLVFPPANYAFGRSGLTWADPGPTTFDFRPGAVNVQASRSGSLPVSGWTWLQASLTGADATSTVHASAGVESDGSSSPVTCTAYPLPGEYAKGAVNFWINQGVEFGLSAPITISEGVTSGQAITVGQADAQTVFVVGPYWASGKPGTAARFWLRRFPAGWKNAVTGYSEYPPTYAPKTHLSWTSTGAEDQFPKRTVPKDARPGYAYWFRFQHSNGLAQLRLEAPFQVCTLKASDASIRAGQSIRLSGVIPTQDHWGATPGKVKTVVVYKRTKSAGPPTVWDATRKGWTKVGSRQASGLGKYRTGLLRPKRTTWYIVRYPGDDWYWRGYTSVLKVTVR
jgi:hypothetical protein